MNRHLAILVLGLLASSLAVGCSANPTGTVRPGDGPLVQSVVPKAGATNVDASAPIVITFNRAMMSGMELLVALHEGSVTGPQVSGKPAWSADRMQLTFTPDQPLKPATTYVLHMSPNLMDVNGNRVDFGRCAQSVGGQPAGMMNTMGGGMMGAGWEPGAGTWGYGMTFTFTTR